MAALKHNGDELIRLVKVRCNGEWDASLEITLSVRSNGAVLRKQRWLDSDGGSWKRWLQFTPGAACSTTTLPQQVRRWLEECQYAPLAGCMEDVLHGWQVLCEKHRKTPKAKRRTGEQLALFHAGEDSTERRETKGA